MEVLRYPVPDRSQIVDSKAERCPSGCPPPRLRRFGGPSRRSSRVEGRRERRRMKEHAWKTIPASRIEPYRNISSRNGFNDFPPQNASCYEPVNVGVCGYFRGDLTQFLHSSERHFFAYAVMLVGTCRGPSAVRLVWPSDRAFNWKYLERTPRDSSSP